MYKGNIRKCYPIFLKKRERWIPSCQVLGSVGLIALKSGFPLDSPVRRTIINMEEIMKIFKLVWEVQELEDGRSSNDVTKNWLETRENGVLINTEFLGYNNDYGWLEDFNRYRNNNEFTEDELKVYFE